MGSPKNRVDYFSFLILKLVKKVTQVTFLLLYTRMALAENTQIKRFAYKAF